MPIGAGGTSGPNCHASPPSPSGTTRGALAWNFCGRYRVQRSGGSSTCESAEIRWYSRAMRASYEQTFAEFKGAPLRIQHDVVDLERGEHGVEHADAAAAVLAVEVDVEADPAVEARVQDEHGGIARGHGDAAQVPGDAADRELAVDERLRAAVVDETDLGIEDVGARGEPAERADRPEDVRNVGVLGGADVGSARPGRTRRPDVARRPRRSRRTRRAGRAGVSGEAGRAGGSRRARGARRRGVDRAAHRVRDEQL